MINILIPCSGKAQRFIDAGYLFPKFLLDVPLPHLFGKTGPMIEMVVGNLNLVGNFIFIVREDHYNSYALKYLLPLITRPNDCHIIRTDTITQGAACSCLLAKELINNDDPLVIVNCDQWLDYSSEHFLKFVNENDADGAIITMYATSPKWSFSQVDEETGLIKLVREKEPISTNANTGYYYWSKGKSFVESAEEMINAKDITKNEYYVAPSYNYLINKGKKIYNYPIANFMGTGLPEDLERFTTVMNNRFQNKKI